jgi:hypothetical protein
VAVVYSTVGQDAAIEVAATAGGASLPLSVAAHTTGRLTLGPEIRLGASERQASLGGRGRRLCRRPNRCRSSQRYGDWDVLLRRFKHRRSHAEQMSAIEESVRRRPRYGMRQFVELPRKCSRAREAARRRHLPSTSRSSSPRPIAEVRQGLRAATSGDRFDTRSRSRQPEVRREGPSEPPSTESQEYEARPDRVLPLLTPHCCHTTSAWRL